MRRARILQKCLELWQENQRDLRETRYPRLVTKEPVKSRSDAMGSVQRGIEDLTCVLSDVAEITGLQQREGYAYLRS